MNARKILSQTDSATRVLIALTTEEVEAITEACVIATDHSRESVVKKSFMAIADRIEKQISPDRYPPTGEAIAAMSEFMKDIDPSALTWTTERPTVPGWYFADRGFRAEIIRVFEPSADLSEFSAFAGPIPRPEEAK